MGRSILFKSTYTLIRTTPINFNVERLTVTFKTLSYTQFTIVVMYRPPSAPIQCFFEPFNRVLQEIYGKYVIICGDFNIHYNITIARELCGLIDQCVYKQSVIVSTHIRGNTLDQIITLTYSQHIIIPTSDIQPPYSQIIMSWNVTSTS